MAQTADLNYKVRLISVASLAGIGSYDEVVFNVTPRFSESREVEYTSLTPIHLPGGIQVYKNTRARSFSLTAHLISRTMEEATVNMIYLQTLRGWTMPYFGASSTLSSSDVANRRSASASQAAADSNASGGYTTSDMLERSLDAGEQNKIALNRQKSSGTGVELLGAPPDVLYLYAYSSGVSSGTGQDRPNKFGVNINKVPVVVTSLNIAYPDDVDYIPTYSNGDPRKSEPFPVKMDVEISLVETHSPREYERFDLMKYKKGVLVNF